MLAKRKSQQILDLSVFKIMFDSNQAFIADLIWFLHHLVVLYVSDSQFWSMKWHSVTLGSFYSFGSVKYISRASFKKTLCFARFFHLKATYFASMSECLFCVTNGCWEKLLSWCFAQRKKRKGRHLFFCLTNRWPEVSKCQWTVR